MLQRTIKSALVAVFTLSILAVALSAPARAAAAEDIPVFTFRGSGYGHGLGLSQYGALEAAKQGLTAKQIIQHYFADTKLETKTTRRALIHLDRDKKARSSWSLRPGYEGSFLTVDGERFEDNTYTFASDNGQIVMSWSESGVPQRVVLGPTVTVKPESMTAANLTQVVSASGPFAYTNVRYRGFMVLTAIGSQVELINSVDMEGYLYGVVPRELGDVYNPLPAASQAQAIVARSYAYAKVNAGKKMACTVADQVYGGHSRFTSEANRSAGQATRFEQTSGNSAVAATKGQYVTYNGRVATTYFSSSNGPHTANNEDVWGGSPIGYLRGVKDPYYPKSQNWVVEMTGMEVAARLAARGRGVPGAGTTVWVTDISRTEVINGWAKSVGISWSNGDTSSISPADNVRIALGLRSANFTVANSLRVKPDTIKKYEDGSSAFRLVKGWKYRAISGNSGGAIRTADTKGAYFDIKFKGEGVRWIGPKAPTYGRAKVYVNGKYQRTVNLYRSSTARQQVLYEIRGLDPKKTHTLKVVITTKKSGGYGRIALDRVDVINGKAVFPPTKTYKEYSSYIKRTGKWGTSTSVKNYGGQAYFTKTLGGTATIKFKGNMVRWVGYTTSDGGRAKVYLNGSYKKTVNMQSSSTRRRVVLYQKTALDPTKVHTLRIVNIKAKNSSRAGKMTLDQIQVRAGAAIK